jgi:mRNA-degrading endonuclease RelE of RelBE toxin-antitoxin system
MAYRVEVGPQAGVQLSGLDPAVGAAIERKIIWLAENAEVMMHRRLVGMPHDLAGLCKLRVGDWRILYWDLLRCAMPGTIVGFMSTLSEIEAAADALSPGQKQELLLFLAVRLRAEGATMPEPRAFAREEIAEWIAQDQSDLERFKAGA